MCVYIDFNSFPDVCPYKLKRDNNQNSNNDDCKNNFEEEEKVNIIN